MTKLKSDENPGDTPELDDSHLEAAVLLQIIMDLPPREDAPSGTPDNTAVDIAAETERKATGAAVIETPEIKKFLDPESPEGIALLATLEARFKKNMRRHERLDWERVKVKLEVSPEKLWSLNEMEKTGGEPDVVDYERKDDKYLFFDCSAESPAGRRNIVYDRTAQNWLNTYRPGESFAGNAIDMAEYMGIQIINLKQYRKLQKLGRFDRNTFSWIYTPDATRRTGEALRGNMHFGLVRIDEYNAQAHDERVGFRGALWI